MPNEDISRIISDIAGRGSGSLFFSLCPAPERAIGSGQSKIVFRAYCKLLSKKAGK
jgi:hypothetical protein